jgi:hypothetical protein
MAITSEATKAELGSGATAAAGDGQKNKPVTRNERPKCAVAAREQQRSRRKFQRRNLGAASYSLFEDEQLIAEATTTVLGWLDVRPILRASGDQSAPIPKFFRSRIGNDGQRPGVSLKQSIFLRKISVRSGLLH